MMMNASPPLELKSAEKDIGDDGSGRNLNVKGGQSWTSLSHDTVPYTSHYCEENTYKLIEILLDEHMLPDSNVFAAFVSNKRKQTPVWMQRLGGHDDGEDSPVVWDYHVITIIRDALGKWWVWDHDTVLPCPFPAREYIMKAFKPEVNIRGEYRQWFRVVPGRTFLARFSSDRSHMKTSSASPPPWPVIRGSLAASDMELPLFWNMIQWEDPNTMDVSPSDVYGSVMDVKGILEFLK